MGIPKFFRWLTRRYPLILQQVHREEDIVPIDNLYLDLNGIVHNCVHGNDPKRHERISRLEDMEELWSSIMIAIDEVVHLVKPKKNIFLAVDGVAPRAKMNQQRARRFKSARERALLKAQIEARGKQMPELFDSNAISPGTKFMADLCKQLHFFVKYKINTDPLYQNLNSCVLSDGAVPGEGEHKMLDYIRQLRKDSQYDPNTRHCFYGADADLIMLSLLTHEPHFTIIREEHVVKRNKSGGVQRVELSQTNNFQLIHISLLREYMMLEYKSLNGQLKFKFDIERIIDDFVFFCFFIGNDFLPSLSALDIAEGSLDRLIEFYKTFLPTMTDYITEAGTIHWDRAEKFIELLGAHEKQVFQGRIDEIDYNSRRNGVDRRGQGLTKTVTVSAENQLMLEGEAGTQDLYRSALYAKKKAKVEKYAITKGGKKYKKYLISKKFREDEDGTGKKIPQKDKNTINAKLQALYQTQLQNKTTQAITPTLIEESKIEAKIGLALIEELEEQYLSDLKPEDIPDECVSEPDLQSLESSDTVNEAAKGNLLTAQADIDAKAEEENRKFIQAFVMLYQDDPVKAKRKYYLDKCGFDIETDTGIEKRRIMMKKYLEGLQWVLYYYYKGSPHWRWYYPSHYAPMISDLGVNIVREFLSSKTVIHEFEVDFNCPADPKPYTPFQQLLCIMPLKSARLLPSCYETIARGDLVEFFPEDFEIDLNGKTVAWEALVLIPFADEALFLQKEHEMFSTGRGNLTEEERLRNNSSFIFFSYKFDQQSPGQPLLSTLTSLKQLPIDQSKITLNSEYENVGSEAFSPKILSGVKLPSPGYPSFKTLGVIELKYDSVYVQKQEFQKCQIVIPQCIEESQPEELETYLVKITKAAKKDVFVDFPYQREAFPMSFEDKFSVYTLFGDYQENKYTIQIGEQTRSEKEWDAHVNRIRYKLEDIGIHCPPERTNVLVSCYKVSDINFNSDYDDQYFFKVYEERPTILPLSLMMRVRHPEHYMNLDKRALSPDDEIVPGTPAIVCKVNMYGLMGFSVNRDKRTGNFKVAIDKTTESSKVHDPFMAQKAIQAYKNANAEEVSRSQSYFGEQEIDLMLQVPSGVTAAMTSSFMIKYKNPDTKDRALVDIGLNIKSWAKKQHVPLYVRFAQNEENLAVNQVDGFTNNKFSRANRHVRAHWQYSAALVNILREYKEKFPEVFENALRVRKKDQMPGIRDVLGAEDSNAVGRLKEISRWIESLPISSLPFVDMGFDTLETSMINSINNHRINIKQNFNQINLAVRTHEFIPSKFLFVERFPLWSSMFPENTPDKFRVGDRVLNICSIKRAYVPFGARGTVVGKTEQKIVVLFDEQFLQGSDINGQCELYRGAMIEPTHLMNVTRKFESWLKKHKDKELVESFTEKPKGEEQPQLGGTNINAGAENLTAGQHAGDRGQQNRINNQEVASPNSGPQATVHVSNDQEERKGGNNRKQYRMKSNQQQAHTNQQQAYNNQQQVHSYQSDNNNTSYSSGRGRGSRGGRGGQGGRGGRGERDDRWQSQGYQPAQQQQQQRPAQTSQQAQPVAFSEIPKITFKPISDLGELMSFVNGAQPPQFRSALSQGFPSEGQSIQAAAPIEKAVSETHMTPPFAPLMSQNMVRLESLPFVPTTQKKETPSTQSPVTKNPEQNASQNQ